MLDCAEATGDPTAGRRDSSIRPIVRVHLNDCATRHCLAERVQELGVQRLESTKVPVVSRPPLHVRGSARGSAPSFAALDVIVRVPLMIGFVIGIVSEPYYFTTRACCRLSLKNVAPRQHRAPLVDVVVVLVVVFGAGALVRADRLRHGGRRRGHAS